MDRAWPSAVSAIASGLSAIAALVLVRVTWRYTKLTQAMLAEMRAARSAQLLPKIVPQVVWDGMGARLQYIEIFNAGPGPAFNIEVTLSEEPNGLEWSWRGMVLGAGSSVRFSAQEAMRRMGSSGEMVTDHVDLDSLATRYERIALRGSCRDALGATIRIDEGAPTRVGWRLQSSLGRET